MKRLIIKVVLYIAVFCGLLFSYIIAKSIEGSSINIAPATNYDILSDYNEHVYINSQQLFFDTGNIPSDNSAPAPYELTNSTTFTVNKTENEKNPSQEIYIGLPVLLDEKDMNAEECYNSKNISSYIDDEKIHSNDFLVSKPFHLVTGFDNVDLDQLVNMKKYNEASADLYTIDTSSLIDVTNVKNYYYFGYVLSGKNLVYDRLSDFHFAFLKTNAKTDNTISRWDIPTYLSKQMSKTYFKTLIFKKKIYSHLSTSTSLDIYESDLDSQVIISVLKLDIKDTVNVVYKYNTTTGYFDAKSSPIYSFMQVRNTKISRIAGDYFIEVIGNLKYYSPECLTEYKVIEKKDNYVKVSSTFLSQDIKINFSKENSSNTDDYIKHNVAQTIYVVIIPALFIALGIIIFIDIEKNIILKIRKIRNNI